MPLKLISFIGINNYKFYNIKLKTELKKIRFAQEAILRKAYDENLIVDKIIIIATKLAIEKNWKDNGHCDKNGNPIEIKGLESTFKSLISEGYNFQYEIVEIPEGKSEEEIYSIFENVYNSIVQGEEILFDITHSFRSIPLIISSLLNYLILMKDVKLSGIWYCVEPPNENGELKIIDLSMYVLLTELNFAINNFEINGDSSLISNFCKKNLSKFSDSNVIEEFSAQLQHLTDIIKIPRGREINEIFDYDKLRENIKELELSLKFPLLKPLFNKILRKIREFYNNDYENGYIAVRWCIDHKMVQQGITILEENIITEIMIKLPEIFEKSDLTNIVKREIIRSAIHIKSRSLPEEEWNLGGGSESDNEQRKEILKKILPHLNPETCRLIDNDIAKLRNDVNHAGWRNNAKEPNRINEEFKKAYYNIRLRGILNEEWGEFPF